MKFKRAMVVLALFCAGAVHAQGWAPQKNVEIVAPTPPGGTIDKFARSIERTLITAKLVTTSMSIVNKPGGGNQIAYAYVSQHAGDPHYLLIGTTTLLTSHITGASKLTYTDFTPIASLFNDNIAFAVNSASEIREGKDLVARMRSAPQRLPGSLAGVPTWKEQGIDLVYGSWRTIAAPRGITREQAEFWENALRRVSETTE